MNKQTIVIVVGAIALFVAALLGTMAFTGSDSNSGGNVHQMPDGSTMTDPMTTTKPTPIMTDETMPGMTNETP